jgi:hypothetical protein
MAGYKQSAFNPRNVWWCFNRHPSHQGCKIANGSWQLAKPRRGNQGPEASTTTGFIGLNNL